MPKLHFTLFQVFRQWEVTHNKERKDKHKESRWCIFMFSLCSLLQPLPTIQALDTGYCMWLCVLKRFSEKKILTSLGHCNESLSPVKSHSGVAQPVNAQKPICSAITHSIFPTQELIYKSCTLRSLKNTIGTIALNLFGINHLKSCSKRHFICILLNTNLFDFDVCVYELNTLQSYSREKTILSKDHNQFYIYYIQYILHLLHL